MSDETLRSIFGSTLPELNKPRGRLRRATATPAVRPPAAASAARPPAASNEERLPAAAQAAASLNAARKAREEVVPKGYKMKRKAAAPAAAPRITAPMDRAQMLQIPRNRVHATKPWRDGFSRVFPTCQDGSAAMHGVAAKDLGVRASATATTTRSDWWDDDEVGAPDPDPAVAAPADAPAAATSAAVPPAAEPTPSPRPPSPRRRPGPVEIIRRGPTRRAGADGSRPQVPTIAPRRPGSAELHQTLEAARADGGDLSARDRKRRRSDDGGGLAMALAAHLGKKRARRE